MTLHTHHNQSIILLLNMLEIYMRHPYTVYSNMSLNLHEDVNQAFIVVLDTILLNWSIWTILHACFEKKNLQIFIN
jgi:hypothetical protein